MTRLLRNFAMLLAADTVARLMSFALVLYVSRGLGPESLGQLAFAQAMVTYFGVFADLGLTSLAIREIAQRPGDSARIAVSATAAQFAFAIVLQAILGGLVIALPISGATRLLTFLYGLTMVAQALSLIYVLQAHERMGAVAVLRILVQAGSVALAIAALVATRRLLLVPVVVVLVTLYADGLAAVMLRRGKHFVWRRPDLRLARWLVRQGVVFVVTGITVQLLYNFGSLVIGVELHERELGIYSAAWKLTLIMLGVGAILMTAIFPNLSRLASARDQFESFFRKLSAVTGYLALPMAVGAIVLAPDLIAILYGATYRRSAFALQILAVVAALGIYNMLVAHALVAVGRQLAQMWVGVGAAASNVVLALLLTPLYGIDGTAAGSAIAELVSFALFVFIGRRYLPSMAIGAFAANLPIAAGLGIILLLVRILLHPRAGIEILVGVVAFILLSLVLRPGPVGEVLQQILRSRLAGAWVES